MMVMVVVWMASNIFTFHLPTWRHPHPHPHPHSPSNSIRRPWSSRMSRHFLRRKRSASSAHINVVLATSSTVPTPTGPSFCKTLADAETSRDEFENAKISSGNSMRSLDASKVETPNDVPMPRQCSKENTDKNNDAIGTAFTAPKSKALQKLRKRRRSLKKSSGVAPGHRDNKPISNPDTSSTLRRSQSCENRRDGQVDAKEQVIAVELEPSIQGRRPISLDNVAQAIQPQKAVSIYKDPRISHGTADSNAVEVGQLCQPPSELTANPNMKVSLPKPGRGTLNQPIRGDLGPGTQHRSRSRLSAPSRKSSSLPRIAEETAPPTCAPPVGASKVDSARNDSKQTPRSTLPRDIVAHPILSRTMPDPHHGIDIRNDAQSRSSRVQTISDRSHNYQRVSMNGVPNALSRPNQGLCEPRSGASKSFSTHENHGMPKVASNELNRLQTHSSHTIRSMPSHPASKMTASLSHHVTSSASNPGQVSYDARKSCSDSPLQGLNQTSSLPKPSQAPRKLPPTHVKHLSSKGAPVALAEDSRTLSFWEVPDVVVGSRTFFCFLHAPIAKVSLPFDQCRNYAKFKVENLFEWQRDCLFHDEKRPFQNGANLV